MLRFVTSTLAAALVAAPLALATISGTLVPAAERAAESTDPIRLTAATSGERLLAAGFDSLATGPMSAREFNSQMGSSIGSDFIFDDSSVVKRGKGKAYQLTLTAGSFKNYPSGNNGINAIVPLRKKVDKACIAYGIRFDGEFDWSLGGKLPGLGGVAPGVSPGTPTGGGNPGSAGWSGRMMWVGPKAYSWAAPTNQAVSYMYSPRQSSEYGDNIRWNMPFKRGTWHRVKQCYTMNTVGKANGKLHAWMDGRQVLARNDYVFRTSTDVHITHLYWAVFRGGGDRSWAGSRTGHIRFDNVRVVAG